MDRPGGDVCDGQCAEVSTGATLAVPAAYDAPRCQTSRMAAAQHLRARATVSTALRAIDAWRREFPDDREVATACSHYSRIADDLRDELDGARRGDRLAALTAQLEELR